MMTIQNSEFEFIFKKSSEESSKLHQKKILLTGGSGFVGIWLLHYFQWLVKTKDLNIEVDILARRPDRIKKVFPDYCLKGRLLSGDIRNYKFENYPYNIIIHAAATTARDTFNGIDQKESFDIVANGTRNLLNFASTIYPEKFLYLSSGACYGLASQNTPFINEDCLLCPDQSEPNAGLGLGKRAAEKFCIEYAGSGRNLTIARSFALYGPYLPLDIHYAVGNFVGSIVDKKNIVLKSTGTACRSYLYASDLIVWLLKILMNGQSGQAYNVGSENYLSINSLAVLINSLSESKVLIEVPATPKEAPSFFVPRTELARTTLGLESWTPLEIGLSKMIAHVQANREIYRRL